MHVFVCVLVHIALSALVGRSLSRVVSDAITAISSWQRASLTSSCLVGLFPSLNCPRESLGPGILDLALGFCRTVEQSCHCKIKKAHKSFFPVPALSVLIT
ncbi:hypothetical protein ILYODFUR_005218 [Ilyodon furcidens]|uniref:Secreted protein n=1 Tax=Ilyodon furcidens TaxID=33524 RepID=A0ABV0SIK8_9TELE